MTMSPERCSSNATSHWLEEVDSEAVYEAHRNGSLHIHDLDTPLSHHAEWSLCCLLQEGFNLTAANGKIDPPRCLHEAVTAIAAFHHTMQTEWANAQTLSSLDTCLAPYVRVHRLDYAHVKQCIRELVENLKVRSHHGVRSPVTNLGFDWTCPSDWHAQAPPIGGESMPFTYGDLDLEIAMVNRAFIEVMMTSDVRDQDFALPVPIYAITHDFDWTHPNAALLFEMTARNGLPYFHNQLHSERQPQHCPHFAAPTGSVGAVTLNGARIGYAYRGDEPQLYARLDILLELAKDALEARRAHLQRRLDHGQPPHTSRYVKCLTHYASTISVSGVNEMICNFSADKNPIATSRGHAFALRLVDHLLARLEEFTLQTGHRFVLDATTAEYVSQRFAQEDHKRCPSILQANMPFHPSYTHSMQWPAAWTDDPFELLEWQEALQTKYTGTTALHFYLNDAIPSAQACRELVKRAFVNFRVPLIAITPAFSCCPEHGYLAGRHTFCPQCDAAWLGKQPMPRALPDEARTRCEFWTRVMGYHRPASAFVGGKQSELSERCVGVCA